MSLLDAATRISESKSWYAAPVRCVMTAVIRLLVKYKAYLIALDARDVAVLKRHARDLARCARETNDPGRAAEIVDRAIRILAVCKMRERELDAATKSLNKYKAAYAALKLQGTAP